MTLEDFEDTLRRFIRHEPFEPFVVERNDGTIIYIIHRGVAFGGGTAAYISPDYELVEFAYEDVRAIRPLTHETAS